MGKEPMVIFGKNSEISIAAMPMTSHARPIQYPRSHKKMSNWSASTIPSPGICRIALSTRIKVEIGSGFPGFTGSTSAGRSTMALSPAESDGRREPEIDLTPAKWAAEVDNRPGRYVSGWRQNTAKGWIASNHGTASDTAPGVSGGDVSVWGDRARDIPGACAEVAVALHALEIAAKGAADLAGNEPCLIAGPASGLRAVEGDPRIGLCPGPSSEHVWIDRGRRGWRDGWGGWTAATGGGQSHQQQRMLHAPNDTPDAYLLNREAMAKGDAFPRCHKEGTCCVG